MAIPPSEKKSKIKWPSWSPKQANLLFVILSFAVLFFFYYYLQSKEGIQNLTYTEFLKDLQDGKVAEVTLSKEEIRGSLKDVPKGKPDKFVTVRVEDPNLTKSLQDKGVSFQGVREDNFWRTLLSWIIPLLLLFAFWKWMLGRLDLTSKGGGFLSLGKSKAKVYVEKDLKTTFDDVAGCEEAKAELKEVVDFLKQPEKYTRLGGRIPKGTLLVGPPGTGKTLLARAVAGEANVMFLSINGSEFVEMFVGLGAARVRDLFDQARQNAPCIIFIDELDALGKSRGFTSLGTGATDESEQTLQQLLAELDGFDPSQGVLLLAATNRPEVLDPALLRAGRFDRQVLLDKPDHEGRRAILKIHCKNVKLNQSVDLEKVASITAGFSGADLANLVNEAALTATRRGAEAIFPDDFTVALERIVAGLERKKRLMNLEEKRRVAYHEMGHATVSLALEAGEKVHKISIIPRGIGSLGYTLQRPTEDRYLMSRQELLHKMAVMMGGRASEALHFKDPSTGAADDFVKASDVARAMVTQYGMSEKLGMVSYEKETAPFLKGRLEWQRTNFSERTAEQIDAEVKALTDEAYGLAVNLLKKHHTFVEAGAKKLLEKETLGEEEINQMWKKLGAPSQEPIRQVK